MKVSLKKISPYESVLPVSTNNKIKDTLKSSGIQMDLIYFPKAFILGHIVDDSSLHIISQENKNVCHLNLQSKCNNFHLKQLLSCHLSCVSCGIIVKKAITYSFYYIQMKSLGASQFAYLSTILSFYNINRVSSVSWTLQTLSCLSFP